MALQSSGWENSGSNYPTTVHCSCCCTQTDGWFSEVAELSPRHVEPDRLSNPRSRRLKKYNACGPLPQGGAWAAGQTGTPSRCKQAVTALPQSSRDDMLTRRCFSELQDLEQQVLQPLSGRRALSGLPGALRVIGRSHACAELIEHRPQWPRLMRPIARLLCHVPLRLPQQSAYALMLECVG